MKTSYKFYYVFIPIFIAIFILLLHTYTNEQNIAKPANEEWSHPLYLMDVTKANSPEMNINAQNQLEVLVNDQELNRFFIENGKIFNHEIISTQGTSIEDNTEIKNADSFLLWVNNHILEMGFIENNSLKLVPFSLKDIEGYQWIHENGKSYLITSTLSDGINIYQKEVKNGLPTFRLLATQKGFPASKYIKGIVNQNNIEVYTLSILDNMNLNYYKTTFSLTQNQWEPFQHLYHELRLESMFDLSNVQFVPHDQEINVYMITRKRLATSISRKIEYVSFNRTTGEMLGQPQTIENPVLFGNDSPNTEYIQFIKSQNGIDQFIAAAYGGEGRENAKYKIAKLSIEQGKVKNYEFLNKGSNYSKSPVYLIDDNGDYVSWFDVQKGGYQLVVSSQNPEFKQVVNKQMKGKWLLAFGITFQNIWIAFLTFLKGMIWLIIPLLVLLIISFTTKPEWMDKHYKLLVISTSALFTIVQVMDINFFYKPYMVSYMPVWLTFTGGKLLIPILLASALFYPTWALMKKIELPSPYASFFYFVLVDLILINLLYAPYMVF